MSNFEENQRHNQSMQATFEKSFSNFKGQLNSYTKVNKDMPTYEKSFMKNQQENNTILNLKAESSEAIL